MNTNFPGIRTSRDYAKFAELQDSFLASDQIGELCRKGKPVFYAYLQNGKYVESQMRSFVAGKLAAEALQPIKPYVCKLCGQRIDDGQPCGCGAR